MTISSETKSSYGKSEKEKIKQIVEQLFILEQQQVYFARNIFSRPGQKTINEFLVQMNHSFFSLFLTVCIMCQN